MYHHSRTPLRVPIVAIFITLFAMLLFGGASEAVPTLSTQPSGIEVASTATTGHQMTAEITRVTSAGTQDHFECFRKRNVGCSQTRNGTVIHGRCWRLPQVGQQFPLCPRFRGADRRDCTVSSGLTCTVNTIPASVANKTDISGHWWLPLGFRSLPLVEPLLTSP